MKPIFGPIVFLSGIGLAVWIAYNLWIERLPETQDMNPLPAISTSLAFIFVGYKWMTGQKIG
jgi:hypothetical protein